ncbi:MAG: DUF6159 family protein [Anaerolinea sp.]|nr:DUF6159 family protein [Anaerolinea sp.]
MNRIQNAAELTRQSWNALMRNKHLLVFPLISVIAMIIVTILFFIPISATGIVSAFADQNTPISDTAYIISAVTLFLYYIAANFVAIFSNTALVGAALKLVRGEQATVQDGINIAMDRLGTIFVYAVISATVGAIARSIRDAGSRSDNVITAILSAILGGLLQGAWNVIVFFVIPVLAHEKIGPIEAMKRSFELFKRTWGEGFVGSTVIGGISCLAYIAVAVIGGLLIAGGMALDSVPLVIAAIVLVVLGFFILSLISGALNGIFQASLFNYALTGDAGAFIDTQLAANAFAVRR